MTTSHFLARSARPFAAAFLACALLGGALDARARDALALGATYRYYLTYPAGYENAALSVYEGSTPICRGVAAYVADFGEPFGWCDLSPSTSGWHVYDVTSYDGSAHLYQFKLFVAQGPLPTTTSVFRSYAQGNTLDGGIVWTHPYLYSRTRGPAGPDYPGDPPSDGVVPAQGAVTWTFNGVTASCGSSLTCWPTKPGRYTVTASFQANALYGASSATMQLGVSKPRIDFDQNLNADILWQNTAGRSALWLMNGATVRSGRELFPAGSGWTPRLVGAWSTSGTVMLFTHVDGRTCMLRLFSTLQINAPADCVELRAAGSGWTPRLLADLDRSTSFNEKDDDIVWEHDDGRVEIWMMQFSSTQPKAIATVLPDPGSGWHPKFTADFNGDGNADIFWQHDDGTPAIWLMKGTTVLGGGRLFGANTGWMAAFAPDLDGDGKADLLWTHTDGRVAAWLMNGAQQVGAATLLPAGTGFTPILVGDIDGDGKSDIVWERTDGRTAYWTMNGTTQTGGSGMYAAGSGWKVLRIADFNGDGYLDHLAQHTDGRVAIGIFDGAGSFTPTTILPAATGFSPVVVPE